MALLFAAACGSQQLATEAPDDVELEPATVAGLAAAILTHVDTDSVKRASGSGNEHEKWKVVTLELEAGGVVVPVDVMVSEYTSETVRPSPGEMCADDPAVLSCRTETTPDGSVVGLLTSREDLTGGWHGSGLTAYVGHFRDDYMVLVMETLSSRKPYYVDMTQLPLDLTVLLEIATDPLVGTHTSPELNATGKNLQGLHLG